MVFSKRLLVYCQCLRFGPTQPVDLLRKRFFQVHSQQMAPQRRLNQLLNALNEAPETVGTLKLGDITYEVPASLTPSRLPRSSTLLDVNDPVNLDNLHFILQKYLLGQDVFLVSQPGPYARRLALTFARCAKPSILFYFDVMVVASSTPSTSISHFTETLERQS